MVETAVERDAHGRFVKGAVGNPAGRPKGSRNKHQEIKASILDAFHELGGTEGLVQWVLADATGKRRGDFYRLCVAVLPKDMTIEAIDSRRSIAEYDTSELVALLTEVPRVEDQRDSGARDVE